MRRLIKESGYVRFEYDSWGDWLQELGRPNTTERRGSMDELGDHPEENFAGVASFKEAMSLATSGWHGTAALSIEATARSIALSVGVATEKIEHRMDGGGAIDMGAFSEGVPECFISLDESTEPRRACRIVANIAVLGCEDKSDIIERGAATLAIIRALELGGVACEVIISPCSVNSNGKTAECSVTIKHADDPVDIPRLAFAVAHPAAFRCLMFKFRANEPELAKYDKTEWRSTHARLKGDILIDSISVRDHRSGAAGFVADALKAQGVTLAKAN